MDIQKSIPELCNVLGVSVSMTEEWQDTSAELTITVPTYYGIDIKAMQPEEYLYAALAGIYAYQKNKIQTQADSKSNEPIVPPKRVSPLAKIFKGCRKAKDSSV